MNQKMISLSGTWEIVKDAENLGASHGWQKTPPATECERITVPEHIPNSECVGAHPYADLMLSNAVTYYGHN